MAAMSLMHGLKVVVKNTFLDIEDPAAEEQQPRLRRAKTDTAALRVHAVCSQNHEPRRGESAIDAKLEHGDVGSTAVAEPSAIETVKAAMVAGLAAVAGLPTDIGDSATLDAAGMLVRQCGLAAESAVSVWWSVGDDSEAVCKAEHSHEGGRTTVMLRNVPNDYTRAMLLDLLDKSGFAGRYDFVYLPVDFSRKAGLGYAFVNMCCATDAIAVQRRLEGFRRWSVPSGKTCSVGWSEPCQGLEANIERYRNSPVMHKSVPEEFKPLLFVDGKPACFPKPTRRLKKPDQVRSGRREAQ